MAQDHRGSREGARRVTGVEEEARRRADLVREAERPERGHRLTAVEREPLALAHEDADRDDPTTWGPILRYVADEGLALDDFDVLAARAAPLAVFAAAWGGWVPLAAVFVYRTTTYTYRLTDRALVLDYGFWFRPVPPVALADVTDVTPRAGPLGRLLGVGSVEVRTAQRLARLTGVRCPAAVAEQIRAAAAACRKP